MSHSLIKFQLGPVQDFIAAARSTRDLWSGSYLLSWLAAAGIRELQSQGGKLIFPNPKGQPLLADPIDTSDVAKLLTPNLPNLFIAAVEGDPAEIAKIVTLKIDQEWRAIADAVWDQRAKLGVADAMKERFFAQVTRHLSISWRATPFVDGNYADAYRDNGWHLDAVRQTRNFDGWHNGSGGSEKDSLTGKEEAVCGGKSGQGDNFSRRVSPDYRRFFKHNDYLGAVTLIKRVWHIAYLKESSWKIDVDRLKIRSIPAIAARTNKLDDDEEVQEKVSGENYIAAIAFDGDSIGKWINGDFLAKGGDLRTHHEDFSAYLSDFALKKARATVETGGADPSDLIGGFLVYAGGDDVVALVPADSALKVASDLRKKFQESTGQTKSTGPRPDASAGIAIGHIHAPLQDLVKEAQKAEKRAKKEGPKPAFSITLMKRSGEISHWTSQWESGAIALHDLIFTSVQDGKLSSRFPHRFIELLSFYQTHPTGLGKLSDAPDFDAKKVILREFEHTTRRQGSPEVAEVLVKALDDYLEKHSDDPQSLIEGLSGLCTTLAFVFRNLPNLKGQTAAYA